MRARNRLSEAPYRAVRGSPPGPGPQPIRRSRGTPLSPSGPHGSAGRPPSASPRARSTSSRRSRLDADGIPRGRIREASASRASEVFRSPPLPPRLLLRLGRRIDQRAGEIPEVRQRLHLLARDLDDRDRDVVAAVELLEPACAGPRAAARACSARSSSAASARRRRPGSSRRARGRSAPPARRWS